MKVLVVDDDRELVALIASVLETEGYAVQTAFNGEEAIGQALEKHPDLILMDLRMPIMDGWTCCRLLKQQARTVDIPVIVISAEGLGAGAHIDLGAQFVLNNPASFMLPVRLVER